MAVGSTGHLPDIHVARHLPDSSQTSASTTCSSAEKSEISCHSSLSAYFLVPFAKRLFGPLARFTRPSLFNRLENGQEDFDAMFAMEEKLGKGSFGEVYACHRLGRFASTLDGDRSLCVKVIPLNGRHEIRTCKFSEQEKSDFFHLLASLESPHIVSYHHFMESSDTMYVIMDRCEGPELMEHVEACGGLLELEVVQSWARQILSALRVVHSWKLMHRDVKPDNFRFDDRSASTLKLLDFGAVKSCSDGPSDVLHTVSGTLLYAAPEVFDGYYWYACDCWSVGIILFLLISGQLPFETSDVTMLRSMHKDPVLTGDCLFRGARWKQVRSAARQLVRGLLSVDPHKRFTAEAAGCHPWVLGDEGDGSDCSGSLPRSHSSRLALVDLKRSGFNWNLAEYVDDDDDDIDGSQGNRWSRQTTPTWKGNQMLGCEHEDVTQRSLAATKVLPEHEDVSQRPLAAAKVLHGYGDVTQRSLAATKALSEHGDSTQRPLAAAKVLPAMQPYVAA